MSDTWCQTVLHQTDDAGPHTYQMLWCVDTVWWPLTYGMKFCLTPQNSQLREILQHYHGPTACGPLCNQVEGSGGPHIVSSRNSIGLVCGPASSVWCNTLWHLVSLIAQPMVPSVVNITSSTDLMKLLFVMVKDCLQLKIILLFRTWNDFVVLM